VPGDGAWLWRIITPEEQPVTFQLPFILSSSGVVQHDGGQRFSNITLKAFADMGWEIVNFSSAGPSYFGYQSGCSCFGLEVHNTKIGPKLFAM